jgi:two-component system, OmpR family, phosphate regulon response regulator PhoB
MAQLGCMHPVRDGQRRERVGEAPSRPRRPLARDGIRRPEEDTDAVGSATRSSRAAILCVDDEPDALAVLGWFLTGEGFRAITACSGAEALLRMQQQLPIITDYMMPGMTGLELCRRLRVCEETRHTPIILHTALRLPPVSWLYDWTLIKPTDLDVFATEIRALLARTHRWCVGSRARP